MAHKKGVGSSKNGRESESKRLGVKIFWWTSCYSEHHRTRGSKHIQVKMFTLVKITPYTQE
jgi:large subunit ribosomal protein L27